ncbi:IucA/IucC family protein [Metabacillus iocasae]|uniref:Siderophore synthetase component n=1 Tax=Priestia iocasae TaxID=2291674 RepID=A0ABS2QYH9_9BACI|nr:IucA/IucC family protein [Metabacillus iocasae]MBM7704548.1 siderophore synthetase component [Metabacillus iocasae]
MLQPLCCKAELRVKRQVIEAVLFEEILPYENSDRTYYIYGHNGVYQCEARETAFGRFRVNEESIYYIEKDGSLANVSLEQLVNELTTDSEVQTRLLNELQQTIRLTEWNESKLAPHLQSRRDLPFEELESEIMEGHPYHPCYKSRTGFTIDDHQQFGPEAKKSFSLQWIAVRRSDVNIAFPYEEPEFFKKELGVEVWESFTSQLQQAEKNVIDYTFLPVHPWQWRNLVESGRLEEVLRNGDLLPLDFKGDFYRATQSVRTLWNETNREKAHIKLPMNMVNTSSLRTLASHSVCTAPHISLWLQKIVDSDPFLKKSLVLLQEYAGAIYEPKDEALKEKMDGQLGVIWRESVRCHMNENEEAVPFTAFMMMERDGKLFIEHWLTKYGRDKWIERFIEVTVLPVWHLLIAHGVGVEAHAQNMVLLHQDGWPTRVVLRDFHESVEYTEDYLANPSILPAFQSLHPLYKDATNDEYYWMSSVEGLRELVMDTLFVFHLSELSFVLEEHSGYEESVFWLNVHKAIERHLEHFPHLRKRHEQLCMNQEHIYVESLLTKKISTTKQESYRHLISNTLAMI